MTQPELKLIEEAKNGCKEAFDALFQKHQKYIYNLLYQLTGEHTEADDLAQETFIRVYEKLDSFRAESSLRTWVSHIAVNIFRQTVRRKKHPPQLKLEELRIPCKGENPERTVIRQELQWCVRHVLRYHIPTHFREVLVLRDLQGFNYAEIGDILGISLSSVKTRLHRARTAFRDHFIESGCKAMVEEYLCFCDEVEAI